MLNGLTVLEFMQVVFSSRARDICTVKLADTDDIEFIIRIRLDLLGFGSTGDNDMQHDGSYSNLS